ncbi:MAG: hypothetical protein L0H73_08670 [Nitrococcus sp.]|nr:hypothetical protein [Nitrococcus sp.]
MKFLAILCKSLGYIWLLLSSKTVLVYMFMIWFRAKFIGIQDLVSTNCIAIYIVTVITVAPGVGLLVLSNYLTKRAIRRGKGDLSKHEKALQLIQERKNGGVWQGRGDA